MRYNETEELEATGEWLLRFNDVGFSEELLYVPSQLSKLGVAPVDVVDRLAWLREKDHDTNGSDHDKIEPLVFDYDIYGAWEWIEPIEKMLEEAILATFNEDSGVPRFNELAALSRPRSRGKRARAARAAKPTEELASSKSVGTNK